MKERQYLSSQNVDDIIKCAAFGKYLQEFFLRWKEYLSKDETKYIKTVITIHNKAWNSIVDRLKPNQCEQIEKKNKAMDVVMMDNFRQQQLEKRFTERLDKLFEEDRYYRICEIAMSLNCANCTGKDKECGLYEQFVLNAVPEPTGEKFRGKSCRFAYEYKEPKGKK